MRDQVDQKDLHLVCSQKSDDDDEESNLGFEYETNMFSSSPIHSTSLNYDLDL